MQWKAGSWPGLEPRAGSNSRERSTAKAASSPGAQGLPEAEMEADSLPTQVSKLRVQQE